MLVPITEELAEKLSRFIEFNNWEFLGDAAYGAALEAYVQEAEISGRVNLFGSLANQETIRALRHQESTRRSSPTSSNGHSPETIKCRPGPGERVREFLVSRSGEWVPLMEIYTQCRALTSTTRKALQELETVEIRGSGQKGSPREVRYTVK